jgi:menaquinone-9 beta-reductase
VVHVIAPSEAKIFDTDVLVVGGGPAGLAAAIAARRKGFRVRVVESAHPPIDKACGEGLMPDALQALGELGVRIPEGTGGVFRGIRFVGHDSFDGDVTVEAEFPSRYALAVRRTELHQILADAAVGAGVELCWGNGAVELADARARWIVGADGYNSKVRKWAGLERWRRRRERYGFRVHYQVTPWSEFVEVHWHADFQMYVAPVGAEEVLVALLSRDPHLRVAEALESFPELQDRLGDAPRTTMERGGISATRKLWTVTQGAVALVGDASGSVDAITGEGLGLAFRQALALADALESSSGTGNLDRYEAAHRRLARRPAFMADLLLLLDGRAGLQDRALRYLARHPLVFRFLLAWHVGALRNPMRFFEGGE